MRWLRIDRLFSVSKFELCIGAYRISWGPANWVASCVTETEAIIPYLTGVHWDSAWVTYGVSVEAYVWKTCTRVRWALIVSTTLWTIATRSDFLACLCRATRYISCQFYSVLTVFCILFHSVPENLGMRFLLRGVVLSLPKILNFGMWLKFTKF
jgi:hypothetical protein